MERKKISVFSEYIFALLFIVAGILIAAGVLHPSLDVVAIVVAFAYGKACLTKAQLLEITK